MGDAPGKRGFGRSAEAIAVLVRDGSHYHTLPKLRVPGNIVPLPFPRRSAARTFCCVHELVPSTAVGRPSKTALNDPSNSEIALTHPYRTPKRSGGTLI
jgi:hypothetical protein